MDVQTRAGAQKQEEKHAVHSAVQTFTYAQT